MFEHDDDIDLRTCAAVDTVDTDCIPHTDSMDTDEYSLPGRYVETVALVESGKRLDTVDADCIPHTDGKGISA